MIQIIPVESRIRIFMKRIIVSFLIITGIVLNISGQYHPVMVTGNYQQVPLDVFFNELELSYPIKFFYDLTDIGSIRVDTTFNETPLERCLEIVLKKARLKSYISENNQVTVYHGSGLSGLFQVSDTGRDVKKEPVPDKKSLTESIHQIRNIVINIGTPGKNEGNTATITGYMKNSDTGEPVIGGNIYISERSMETSSNSIGYYKITLPTGSQTLNFTCIGMLPVKRSINLFSDGRLDIEMKMATYVLDEAIIIGYGNSYLGQMHIGMEKIDKITIKSIPSILGEADVMKSILTLPGVQVVGEGTSGFNVRGGNTDQNLILIDQSPIYYPFHFFGNFSAINSEIIESATLYKGSIPLKYGGRISSVFEINTIEGGHERISGSAGISPISARINVDGPFIFKKSSFVSSFRSTYTNWIMNAIKVTQFYKSKAGFYDAKAKFKLFIDDKSDLVVDFYKSNDKFSLHSDTTYNYNNLIASLVLKHKFNSKFKSNTSLLCSLFNYNISNEVSTNQSFDLTHSLSNVSLVNDFEYLTEKNIKYDFGGALTLYSINPGERKVPYYSNIIPVNTDNEKAMEFGIYAGSEFKVTGNLKIDGGIRLTGLLSYDDGKRYIYSEGLPYDEDNITDIISTDKNKVQRIYMNPEWRVALNYLAGIQSSFKFTYNKTAQYLHMLSNTTAISPTDTWKLSDVYLLPETGHQLSTGYFWSSGNNKIKASAEVYYKWIKNIKEYKAGASLLLNDHIETEIVNANGKCYGLELSFEKSGGRIYGRVGYTWSRTMIRSVTLFKENMINNGEFFPANYDKPHSLNVLFNLKASRRFIISTDLSYSTGRPITYPVAKYQLGDQVFLQYSKYNQYRIPDYFRTDLSVTFNDNLKKNQLIHSSFTFSLYNLTGRKNVYSIYFKNEGERFEAYKLSIFGTIIPTITYNLIF